MITLQSTFAYSDGEEPPVSYASVSVTHPVLRVTLLNPTTFEASLETTDVHLFHTGLYLNRKTYSVDVPATDLFRPDLTLAVTNWLRWLLKRDNLFPKLDDLSIGFKVNYQGEVEDPVSLEAIWFHISLQPIPGAGALDTDGWVENGLYAVNKTTYLEIVSQLWPELPVEKRSMLLYAINNVVEPSQNRPPKFNNTNEAKEALGVFLRQMELPDDDSVFQFLRNNFSRLFDLPIRISKLKPVVLAGNVHVKPSPNGTIPTVNFDWYHLSAEFYLAAENGPRQKISHYDWDDQTVRQDKRLIFKFVDKELRTSISGSVIVRLKSFQGSEVYRGEFQATDPGLQRLDIAVQGIAPAPIGSSGGPNAQGAKKLRGKVVALSKSCTLKGVIVVEAKTKTQDPWRVVTTANSDKDGNFAMPYPYGTFVEAKALVSLDETSTTPLKILPHNPGETISADFIYIMLKKTDKGPTDKDDCNCNPTTTAGRLPSQDDLLQSNQFTQDIGGGCMNLMVPNRTLREFGYHAMVRYTDPDVANYTLRSEVISGTPTDPIERRTYYLEKKGKVERGYIDIDNPVRWHDSRVLDNEPDLELQVFQSVTVATGHILHYKSEFKADGYSLGDLLYSLPLAPGQKKQIVTFDSSHTFLGSETQSLTQSEQLANNLISERNIVDQIAGDISEALSGSSTASTSGVSAGLGAAGSTGAFGGSLGVAGGYSNSNSRASQNGSRNLSQFFSERLRQSLQQNASSYRRQNATAITAAQEGQRYSATTESVANHNHCHSLTMMYFEVLRHFAIFQELVDVEECVFVPLLMIRFTIDNISKWADALAPRLLTLHANTFLRPSRVDLGPRRHPLLPAFDAAERVRTSWRMVDYPDGRYCDEPMEWVDGTMDIVAAVPRPNTKYDNILSLPTARQTVTTRQYDAKQVAKDTILTAMSFGLGGGDGKVEVQRVLDTRAKIFDGFMHIDENFETAPAARCIRIKSFNNITPVPDPSGTSINLDPITDFFDNEGGALDMWLAYSELLGYGGTKAGLKQMLSKYFPMQLIGDWDSIWYRRVAPEIFTKVLSHITCTLSFRFDTTQLTRFSSRGEQVVSIAFTAPTTAVRSTVSSVTFASSSSAARKLALTQFVFRIRSIRIDYSTSHFNGTLFSGKMDGDLLDDTGATCPTSRLSAAEKANPRQDDRFQTQRLITHLNQNIEYYNRVLWYSLEADRRYLLLDGFKIETFNKYGDHEGYRSLSSVLKNQLIAVAGNSLVFPVAPGYHVSQSFIVAGPDGERETLSESLLDHYRPDEPPAPYRLSVPTRGVYSEAMMGQCDSCEKVKPDSAQDWTKFTTEEPTSINPLTAPQPTVTNYYPTIKDFAQPMVQIQNSPPPAPDPGIGLKVVTDLMGKSDIFKDVTGLDANQKNAMQAYLSNQDNVKTMAQMATSLVNQAHNTSNSSKIMDMIDQGHAKGAFTESERNKLAKDHAQQVIDGGATKNAELAAEKAAQKPSVTDSVAKAAVDQNRDMTVSVAEPDGTVQTASLRSSGKKKAEVLARVNGLMPIIKQPTADTCWAAAATMMVSWDLQTRVEIENAVRRAGEDFYDLFKAGKALDAPKGKEFVEGLDLTSHGGGSYLYMHYVNLMQRHGPIWVTVDAATAPGPWNPHALIITQIEGGKDFADEDTHFTCIDPGPGKTVRINYTEFRNAFEQTLTDADPKATGVDQLVGVQLIYFPTDITAKVGYKLGFKSKIMGDKPPVHETLTLRALQASAFHLPSTITRGSHAPTDEFLRGVYWNDDPAGLFFTREETKNMNESVGAGWATKFLEAQDSPDNVDDRNIIGRSHFGDLQFLHSMGSTIGEKPAETYSKILWWVEVMYKLATGIIKPNNTLESTTIQRDNRGFHTFFRRRSRPTIKETLRDLLAPNETFRGLNVPRRALGSLLHIVQDSFARGHAKRKLLNPQDQVDAERGIFKPGTWARLGEVENYHVYRNTGQQSKHHDQWDLWDLSEDLSGLWGATDAIDQSIKVINFWHQSEKWENGVEAWAKSCFKYADNATPSDTNV